MKTNYLLLALLLLLSSFLFGCTPKEEKLQEKTENGSATVEKLKVYTTIFPLEDFTKKIGGEHVEVISVYPPGVDAHTFEPTAKTMVDISESDAFIYSGAGLEGFVDAAIEVLQKEDIMIVKAADGIEFAEVDHAGEDEHEGETEAEHAEHAGEDEHEGETEAEHAEHAGEDEHNDGDHDPHVWLDPILATQLAENILHTLEKLKPEAKEEFEKNFNELKLELEKLDGEFKQVIDQASNKEILVSHAAYGYWESRYGIKQISVSGLSPTNEPSQQELTKIIETAKEHNIQYVIFEQNVSTKIAEIVKNEIKAEALTLHNLEALTEEDSKKNEDYFSIMRRNLETLKTALN
ncbi:metal ABC transporter solute-binding protein, Zn/Mn family [Bacillus sp. DJP31]|uniref:metal ABC transporter solute-binding protein, Zn/Mn family n=1 Tax=Bacillus sp. DJP31 TaxID=3409789 RepID=UPI003BB4D55F